MFRQNAPAACRGSLRIATAASNLASLRQGGPHPDYFCSITDRPCKPLIRLASAQRWTHLSLIRYGSGARRSMPPIRVLDPALHHVLDAHDVHVLEVSSAAIRRVDRARRPVVKVDCALNRWLTASQAIRLARRTSA